MPGKPNITLTDGHILVGNTSNVAADVAMSGDVTIADTGATTIKSSVALTGSPTTTTQTAGDNSTKIATTAYVDALADGKIRVGNGSNVATAVTMSGDVTMDDTGVTTIKSSVALAGSPTTTTQTAGDNSTKIATTAYVDSGLSGKASSTLTSGHLYVGSGSNVATDTAITGDVTITNAGVTSIKSSVALTGSPTTTTQTAGDNSTKIATTAYVDALADGKIRIGNGSNVASAVTMSGDVTMDDTGVTTIKSSVALAGSPTTTTQTAGDNSTKIATTAYVDNAVSGGGGGGGCLGAFRNLKIVCSGTTNHNAVITIDEVVLEDSSNQYYTARSVSLTCNSAGTVGAINSLDTGSLATSTWYYLWVIYDGSTIASLLSASSTSPTLPAASFAISSARRFAISRLF